MVQIEIGLEGYLKYELALLDPIVSISSAVKLAPQSELQARYGPTRDTGSQTDADATDAMW